MAPLSFSQRYGPWAVVTGGTHGIGASFVRALAGRGLGVVVVARHADAVRDAVDAVTRAGGRARGVTADLSRADGVDAVLAAVADVEVGLLVCNAAQSTVGAFLDADAHVLDAMLEVNCRATVRLCHALAPGMVRRGNGGILVMSSLAGLQGAPFMAGYAATKAFDVVLAESLWGELQPRGVDVLAVLAGATRTPTYLQSMPAAPGAVAPRAMEPDDVVQEALSALGQGPSHVVGAGNRAGAFALTRLMSRRGAVEMMRRVARRMYGSRLG